MAMTNHERVGKALELLKNGLGPFVEREITNVYKDRSAAEARRRLGDDRLNEKKPIPEWDAAALLKLMWDTWNDVFRLTLGHSERSLVGELREYRNKWAHQESFSGDDAQRALDSAGRLLAAVSAPEADEIEKMKTELLRLRFDEQVRARKRKSAGIAVEGAAAASLKPWREVVTPHRDVASGRYQQAEFAADLWQVHLGEGTDEYRDPVEFFRRTYLTESLNRMRQTPYPGQGNGFPKSPAAVSSLDPRGLESKSSRKGRIEQAVGVEPVNPCRDKRGGEPNLVENLRKNPGD